MIELLALLLPFIFLILWLIMLALGLLGLVFWIFILIDCAKRDFKKPDDKIVWIILLALLGILGAIIYYFTIKIKDKKPAKNEKFSVKARK